MAIVVELGSKIAKLDKFLLSKTGWLNNVTDNIFQALKKDYSSLYWIVNESDANVPWYFSKSDGSFAKNGEILFWYGLSTEEASQLIKEFDSLNLDSALLSSSESGVFSSPVQKRGLHTYNSYFRNSFRNARNSVRKYATKNPNPPLQEGTNTKKAKVALIGARGYTGQNLISLIDLHPYLEILHVLSRELNGQKLQGYNKDNIVYSNLQTEDIKKLEENGEVDVWVMALPNGVCKPFVDAIDSVEGGKSKIVDLSADYRFDTSGEWTYGLPELNDRRGIAGAKRISNPGCYATAAQCAIAPLVEYATGTPTIFGVSGYSGAGTKPSPKNDVKFLENNLIPYSLTDHIHEKEISSQLGIDVAFTPHVAQWFQGISHTILIPIKPESLTDRKRVA